MVSDIPTRMDIEEAKARIEPYVHRTPVLSSRNINSMAGADLFFKCENLQRGGAFKFRGATNAVFSLSEKDARKGVATHSSGNHAQALALAARNRGIGAYIVMPRNSPDVKVNAVRDYGADITFCEPTLKDRETALEGLVERTGAEFIHPYNDPRVIAGQATACMELLEETPDLDMILTPVGGGGLLSGTSLAVKYFGNETSVLAAEPSGADDAKRSLEEGRLIPSVDPDTICDGLLTSLGDLTYRILKSNVERILTVEDDYTVKAMKLIFERMKMVVEPSAAITLGAVLRHGECFSNKRIGIILSGGNVDLEKLPWFESI